MKASSILLTLLGILLPTISPHISFAQSATPTPAPAYVVIINQIRGESCCSPGSLENTRTQLEDAVKYELPTTFVLRYDALTDPRYTELILAYQRLHPTLIQTGVMVEIIPSLVSDTNTQKCDTVDKHCSIFSRKNSLDTQTDHDSSDISTPKVERCLIDENACQIPYHGTDETWFQAQNAFTIGYPIEVRTKIIDTLMTQYHRVFSTYPKVSSAWMIDTNSLNYLHDIYGVDVHQITREQWGTDSYTLYGGPPHYPYPASRSWAFVPDYNEANAVTIVRQTTTDPLYNYGDTTSRFTSQPNDYARGNVTIDYFYTLINNLFTQPYAGFANLGLENSMDAQYQIEFGKQLAYIRTLVDEKKITVKHPDAFRSEFALLGETSVYTRREGLRTAWWVTTPTYRARLIQNELGISVTDVRLYSPHLVDPYTSHVALHEGYWIVPFLIDGSRWHNYRDMSSYAHKFIPVKTDLFTEPTRLTLADTTETITVVITPQKHIEFRDASNKLIALFGPASLILPTDMSYQSHLPKHFPAQFNGQGDLEWRLNDDVAWSLHKTTCDSAHCTYEPVVRPETYTQSITQQYPYLYPEAVRRTLSPQYTRVNVHNTFAIAGRNPVRLVLEPHDAMNFPILLDSEATITVSPIDTVITRLGELRKSQQQYVDLDRHNPAQIRVTVRMEQGGKAYEISRTAYVAPNCKIDWRYCIRHPIQGSWYVITKLQDWWQGRM